MRKDFGGQRFVAALKFGRRRGGALHSSIGQPAPGVQFNPLGNPPALPEDSQSLTEPGRRVIEVTGAEEAG